jgi:serine protease inhibitor
MSAAVIITDQEYPVRPAFSLITKVLDEFTAKVPQSSFKNPAEISFPDINSYIQKYQDPRQADTIMKVQQELDETKIILASYFKQHCATSAIIVANVTSDLAAQDNRDSVATRGEA